ncbi:MAG TPA: hypothetical protein VH458_01850 [Vicinamibacterales bacterium]|jgi:hypothetical protein
MFSKELHHGGHTKKFSIQENGRDGWDVREEHDDRVLREASYSDWHRVERALTAFTLEIGQLEDRGWRADS